ncbi:single-stranded DNA-binding protein [Ferruginibacter profundus]|nr:single-stranded DNA-binding protein [Bacteroidota bacterium]
MEMTARLTGDAKISTLQSGKQVVNFNVAINDSYKSKTTGEVMKMVTYVQCDYWVNPGVAQFLTKGTLVELQGRIGVSAYTGKDGLPKASLTLHVNSIKLHGGKSKQQETIAADKILVGASSETATDDLPF